MKSDLIIPAQSYKELDDETNLYYFNARYYDATTGRFINVDPIQDGTNWYIYCNNNPMNRVDPTGLVTSNEYGWDRTYNIYLNLKKNNFNNLTKTQEQYLKDFFENTPSRHGWYYSFYVYHGNFYGPSYTNGVYYEKEKAKVDLKPIDELDAIAYEHDTLYGMGKFYEADLKMISKLEKLLDKGVVNMYDTDQAAPSFVQKKLLNKAWAAKEYFTRDFYEIFTKYNGGDPEGKQKTGIAIIYYWYKGLHKTKEFQEFYDNYKKEHYAKDKKHKE